MGPEPSEQCPVWVINLRSSDDRRKAISNSLDRLGVAFRIFDAIDGRSGLGQEHDALVDRVAAQKRLYRALSDAEAALQLSHAFIYQQIVAEGHSEAIILEDDAILGDGFAQFATDPERKKHDMILLGHEKARAYNRPVGHLSSGADLFRLRGPCHLAVGYYLSRRGAQFLLEAALPVSYVADWPADISEIGAVAVSPALIGHPLPANAATTLGENRQQIKSASRRGRHARFLTRAYWKKKADGAFGKRLVSSSQVEQSIRQEML